ncbi:MAG: hypothetical protein DYG89_15285 [Caldilinea sp. CFX5]|nr:hypothetical protein [Caldilinea sp. CFX5]
MNLLPVEQRLAELERRLKEIEAQASPATLTLPQDEKVTAAIDLIKKIKRIAQQGGCTMPQAAWALIQRSVPADLTHAIQPFPEAD